MNNVNGESPQFRENQAKQSKSMSELVNSSLYNYLSNDSIESLLTKPDTLFVLPFSATSKPSCAPIKPGIIDCGLPLLDSKQATNEVWSIKDGEITRGVTGNCYWSKTENVIYASIWLDQEQCQTIEKSTFSAYSELLTFIKDQEYKHPFRFWNYIPEINLGEGDKEQYKLFCNGRLDAFKALKMDNEKFPSASALGNHSNGAVFFVLASKTKGLHINNSLQVDAFKYPREYGVTSPSFSRATSIKINAQQLFFISGTASIIGHKTIHEGDIKGQLKTTISNINHLLTNNLQSQAYSTLTSLKIYVRNKEDLTTTKHYFEKAFPDAEKLFTLADICRSNLLVEAECFCE